MESTDNFLVYGTTWNERIGSTWHRILAACDVTHEDTIAEIGPGFTDKLGHALRFLGFAGKVHLVEPNGAARSWATQRYRQLVPEAEVCPIDQKLSRAHVDLVGQIDVVVMNHVLDDLLLESIVEPARLESIFASMHQGADCPDTLRQAWQTLAENPALVRRSSNRVVADVCEFVEATRPRHLVISQNESWYHHRDGLAHADMFGADLLRRLRERFGSRQDVTHDVARRLDVDLARWLIVSPDPQHPSP